MNKLDKYSKEELQALWRTSLTKKEFGQALGYANGNHIYEIQEKYDLLDDDLGVDNPDHKKYMIGPKGKKIEDLSGKTFSNWTVLELDVEKTKKDFKHSWWICQCGCKDATIRSITMNNLKRGKSKSCGCSYISIPIEKMIGMKFGKLTVLKINEEMSSRKGKILYCHCDCGNDINVISVYLRNGKVNSCGCLTSKGEAKIASILNSINIKYEKQYSFPDLINPDTGAFLRFDFAIFPKNSLVPILIEYQGIQHYQEVDFFKEKLDYRQRKDLIKKEYCERKGLILIEIPYTDYEKIDFDYL